MSWWTAITTKGRSLDAEVEMREGILHISGILLDADEDVALIIDRMKNKVYPRVEIEFCEELLKAHGLEIVHRSCLLESQTLQERIESYFKRQPNEDTSES